MAVKHIWRNLWLSVVTVVIILLAVLSSHVLIITNAATSAVNDLFKNKINITVDFSPTATSDDVVVFKKKVEQLNQVQSVRWADSQEVYDRFQARFKGQQVITDALKVVDKNPFGGRLYIQAKTLQDYSDILKTLDGADFSPEKIIQSKSFDDRRDALARFGVIEEQVRWVIIAVVALFVLLGLYVVYNTIKLTIYSHREEIAIMKLVGATNSFIRLPFIFEGFILSFIAVAFGLLIIYPLLQYADPFINQLMQPQVFSLVEYYQQNMLWILGVQLGVIIVVNVLSSAVAVGRYLKV